MEHGRSMIEILGVLAVVGVLSIAGIVGFQKAMVHYKTNQLKDQLSTISSNLIVSFESLGNYTELGENKDDATSLAVKLGVFPENMLQDDGSVRHAFGGNVYIRAVEYGDSEGAAFTIELDGLPKEIAVKLGTDTSNEGNQEFMYIDLNAE